MNNLVNILKYRVNKPIDISKIRLLNGYNVIT